MVLSEIARRRERAKQRELREIEASLKRSDIRRAAKRKKATERRKRRERSSSGGLGLFSVRTRKKSWSW